MIVMPLFVDQYDNAQRVQEMGYGIRMDPYRFQDQDLLDGMKRLLEDKKLAQRLAQAAERIQTSNSKDKACARIEELVK